MNYLYGDSTASLLKSNVLEFFRDALDCSVVLLQADAQIDAGRDRIRTLQKEADAELGRLEKFIGEVEKAIRDASATIPESPTLQCAARLTSFSAEARQASADSVRERLAREIAAVEAEESATRKNCSAALATLLLGQPPPDATTVTRLVLGAGQQPPYEAVLTGSAAFGLEWTFELAIPEGHAWSTAVRVDRFAPQLEIRAPQLAGWISKEVKVRPQKLDRLLITELVDDGEMASVKLRAEGAAEAGFDLEVDCKLQTVTKMMRVGPKDDASVGAFEVHADDVRPLAELVEKLRAASDELTRLRLRVARVEDGAFQEQDRFAGFVGRLVAMMAPIIREISDRSLTPSELILRRLLSNDRREEIFVAKSTLRDKLAVLPEPVRRLFAPLGLDPTPPLPGSPRPTDKPPPLRGGAREPAPPRAELPLSRPPPPLPVRPPATTNSGLSPVAPSEPARPPSATDERITVVASESTPNPESNGKLEAVASVALAAAMKKLVNLSRAGRTDEAYEEYRILFSSAAFPEYAPDDQRQALRQMLAMTTPSPSTDAVLDAHRAAILRAKALVEEHGDPRDHEIVSLIKHVGAL
jgi:hypothetical protein